MVAESFEKVKIKIADLEQEQKKVILDIIHCKAQLDQTNSSLFESRMRELNIREIYRLAHIHFPRLRNTKDQGLTKDDIKEIEKWIGRAKSNENLKGIVDAMAELEKYFPGDVHTNLYALVQKIIQGGAYHSSKKRK